MKNIYTFVSIYLMSLFSFLCNAQMSYEWDLSSNENKHYASCIEHINNLIFISSQSKTLSISAITNNGQLIHKYNYQIDSFYIEAHKIIWIQSKEHFIILGTGTKISNDGQNKQYLIAFILDENFNLKFVKPYRVDSNRHLYYLSYFLSENEDILISLNVLFSAEEDEQFFVSLDNEGNLISIKRDSGLNCYSILKINDGYKCIGVISKNFDSTFNLVSKDEEFYSFIPPYNQSKALSLSSDKILIGTSHADNKLPDYVVKEGGAILHLADNNLNILKTNWMLTGKNFVLPGNIFDESLDSNIFIATNVPPTNGYTSFSIGKFDINLNLKWAINF